MSKSDTFETDLLKLIFQNITIAGIGDTTGIVGSGVAGSLYFGLQLADPGEAGNQSTSEISYTGYTRVAVPRSSGGFTVSGNSVSPASTITFGQMTAGGGGISGFFHVGKSLSGIGEILYSGTISPSITIANGVTPLLTTGTQITED